MLAVELYALGAGIFFNAVDNAAHTVDRHLCAYRRTASAAVVAGQNIKHVGQITPIDARIHIQIAVNAADSLACDNVKRGHFQLQTRLKPARSRIYRAHCAHSPREFKGGTTLQLVRIASLTLHKLTEPLEGNVIIHYAGFPEFIALCYAG